ncbi:enoyl-CoA hydratase-related protein [Streptomyces sp. NPDC048106]|uniref:enoyl-CoA hydratase-related protein n=1 Tax=Streptomyces sp. NPDC048106 TaxID=3155750 RepID=UPI0034556E74
MSDLLLEKSGAVATLWFDRPERRNAVSYEMYREIPRLAGEVAADEAVRVLVVRGAGEVAFSAGADIKEFRTVRAGGEGARRYNAAVAEAERALAGLRVPSIAMIHGYCIGGGCGIAASCDLRLGDTQARFGITPARLGLVYGLESTKRVVDLVGPSTARFLLYSGRHLEARRALECGLLDEIHEPSELERATYGLAEEIAARAPISVQGTKQMIARVLAGQTQDDEETVALRNASFDSKDYEEGVTAFLEKRAPVFRGE